MYALTLALASLAVGAYGATNTTVGANVAACCAALQREHPDLLVNTGDTDFASWNERWAESAELAPSCIFRPQSALDVSYAVKTFSRARNQTGELCPFSVKGGGHTPWAGANNINDGIAIILDDMNETIISEDRTYVSLGAGTIWHDAYRNTDGAGIAFPGGRCPGTGVGGVTLGGGYSWFTGQVGFVADSVLNYEIVLASGEVVNVNKDENSDLFKALKGGANNFGVVTRFDLAVFEHSQQVHGGLVIVPTSSSDEVLDRLQWFTDDEAGIHDTEGLTIEYFVDAATGQGQILLWLIDTDAAGNHTALKPFFEMEPKMVNLVYTSSITDYPTSIPPVSRVLFADATFVNDIEAIKGVYNITMDIMETVSHIPGLTWDFQFEPLSRHVIAASNARGGNMLGLQDIEDDLLIVFLMPLWADAQYDEEVHQAAESWVKAVQEYTTSLGKGNTLEFASYAAGFQDPMSSYGAENRRFLEEVSQKYDPTQFFQKALKGGYKLGVSS